MSKYSENIYNKWVKQSWSIPYQRSGIYAIKSNRGEILYVGKSSEILRRMAEHRAAINAPKGHEYKYGVLNEIEKMTGVNVHFEVLCYATTADQRGEREGYYIRKYMPPLNTQIPHEDNWREWDINPRAREITAEEILNGKKLFTKIL